MIQVDISKYVNSVKLLPLCGIFEGGPEQVSKEDKRFNIKGVRP